MSQTFKVTIRAAAVALLIAAAAGQPARAVFDLSCKPIMDAMMKQVGTPTHLVMTTAPLREHGKPTTHDMIYADDGIFIQVKGRWTRTASLKTVRQQQEENQRDPKSKMSCSYLRDEAVGGETAAVYHAQSEDEGGKTTSTMWVSKRTGLPLKSDTNVDTGNKEPLHMVMTYDYANVHAPAGVK